MFDILVIGVMMLGMRGVKGVLFSCKLVALAMLVVLAQPERSQADWSAGWVSLWVTKPTYTAACVELVNAVNNYNATNRDANWNSQWEQQPLLSNGRCQMTCKAKVASPTVNCSLAYTADLTMKPSCAAGEDADWSSATGCKPQQSMIDPKVFGNNCNCVAKGKNTGVAALLDAGTTDGQSRPTSGNTSTGDPIDVASGNVFFHVTDYESAGTNKLVFARFFNSLAPSAFGQMGSVPAKSLGLGWRHTYDRYIAAAINDNTTLILERADGKQIRFSNHGSSTFYTSYDDNSSYYIRTSSAGSTFTYTVTTPDDAVEVYTRSSTDTSWGVAQLQSITYRNGYKQTLDRSQANKLLVTDSYNRTLTLNYNSDGTVSSVVTPDNTTIAYAYETGRYTGYYLPGNTSYDSTTMLWSVKLDNRLIKVTYPTAPNNPVTYSYYGTPTAVTLPVVNASYEAMLDPVGNYIAPALLNKVTDENGNVKATWTYDKYGRGTSSSGYNGMDKTSISYNTNNTRVVTNAAGVQDTYYYVGMNNISPVLSYISRAATATTAAATKQFWYDGYNHISQVKDWNGNYTSFANDFRGLPTTITEGTGSSVARSTTISYLTTTAPAPYPTGYTFRLPATVKEGIIGSASPLRTTSYGYDTNGNMLSKTVADGTTQAQPSRAWNFTYDSTGNLLTAKNPRGNTTTFTYSNGALATVTDALNHVTTFSNFTGGGYPQQVVDANNVTRNFTYDGRQHLASSAITLSGTARTTTYQWSLAEELKQILYPDGTLLGNYYNYEANGATTLTFLQKDASANQLQYTLNLFGKPIAVQTKDSANTVALSRNMTYDALGRLLTETNADGSKVTTYTYDASGNRLTVKDGLGHTTTTLYDALNRPQKATDANNGITTYAYDALGNVASITDPSNLTTNYTYSGFSDLMKQVSPDTGTTTYSYDANGNLTSKTDGASNVVNMSYDVLDRPLTATYPASSALNVAYTYDESGHGFGVGRLTSFTDASGSLSQSFDEQGLITSQTRKTGGTSYTTYYNYNSTKLLKWLQYPSGAKVTFTYDGAGRPKALAFSATGADSTSVFSSGTYLPFGPMKGLTYNDGVVESLGYDTDLNLKTQSATGVIGLSYGYDNANNLTSLTDSITSANSATYGYDVLNRLTSASNGVYGALSYAYNANGVMTSGTSAGLAVTYTPATGTNRIASASATGHSWSYGYTGAGNTSSVTADGVVTNYSYNAANQLSSVAGSSTESYGYGAGGERLSKTNSGVTAKYVYDPSGHLLAEASAGSSTTREYIYLGDRLMGEYDVAAKKLYSVHTDRMGTPFLLTDKTKAVQWSGVSEPYGRVASSSGSVAQNVRLPGQYDDGAGLYHNGFRDYSPGSLKDPRVGVYLESDPIRLAGGMNVYRYASANPLTNIDPWGLADVTVVDPRDPYRTPTDAYNPSDKFTFAGHGSATDPNNFYTVGDAGEKIGLTPQKISYQDMGDMILAKWDGEKPLYSLACHGNSSGLDGNLAQYLADQIGRDVTIYGANGEVSVHAETTSGSDYSWKIFGYFKVGPSIPTTSKVIITPPTSTWLPKTRSPQ